MKTPNTTQPTKKSFGLCSLFAIALLLGGCSIPNLDNSQSKTETKEVQAGEATTAASPKGDAVGDLLGEHGAMLHDDELAIGEQIYDAKCAECHGPSGEGQPDWQQADENGFLPAPPHDGTGHTWHHADQQLLDVIANGSGMPKTKMPKYADLLTQAEMEAVLSYIKTFWGKREIEFQEQITKQYRG